MGTADYKNELKSKGVISFSPKGESMWPFIKNGKTTVIVKGNQPFALYDVVLYRVNGYYKLHRIIGIDGDKLTVYGDGLAYAEHIFAKDVLGVMTEYYYKGKTVEHSDCKYLKRVQKYYKRKKLRRIRISIHTFFVKVKYKLTVKRGK